jgi:hypothetical protein
MVANGCGGVSGRSDKVSDATLGSSRGNLTWQQVDFRVDGPIIYLDTLIL